MPFPLERDTIFIFQDSFLYKYVFKNTTKGSIYLSACNMCGNATYGELSYNKYVKISLRHGFSNEKKKNKKFFLGKLY